MLTTDEAELYDRQIRLWGVNAQTKLRQSKLLMLGFNGIASEVAKILVLAGIDTLTVVDNEPLSDSDLSSNLFCRTAGEANLRTHAVREKLRVLNPLVKVNIVNEPITSDRVRSELVPSHDFVSLHTFLPLNEIFSINDKCRSHRVKFYIAIDFGYLGFMFNDLGDEFKFTYEEYEAAEQESGQRVKETAASATKNSNHNNSATAITVDEDEDDDDRDDDESCPTDEEGAKPRKRLRVRSPARDSADKDAKRQRMDCLRYCSFSDMLKLDNCQFSRRTSPVLIVSIAMFKFYDKFEHLPGNADEWLEFDKILEQLKDCAQVGDNFKRLDAEWRDNLAKSFSSVCAVLGGVAGQDMIRALSARDIPIFNTFAFDGLNMNGIVEKVGIGETKASQAIKPVVRDLIELDSDGDDVAV